MRFLRNSFLQAVGIAAFVYLVLQALGWGIEATLNMLESFARWYRFHGIKWAEEAALAIGAAYILIAALVSSRSD